MKSRNLFSRADVLKVNEALIKAKAVSSANRVLSSGGSLRLSTSEINRAFAAAKKALADA